MANFTITDFQTQIRSKGVARPNRFEVMIPTPIRLLSTIPDLRLISLFCESANLPTHNIGVRQQRIYGPAYQRPTSVDYGGDGITLSFIIDGNMDVKGYFDSWMQIIVDPNSFHINYSGEYTSTMRITQLNQQDQPVYAAVFEDVFPKTLSMLDLNQGNQNSVQKLNVTFVYRRWYADHSAIDKISKPVTPNKSNPAAPIAPPIQQDISTMYTIPFSNQPYDRETVRSSDPLGLVNNTPFPPVRTGVFGVGTETAEQPWNPPTLIDN
jgi:hypothetical protein